MRIRSLLAVIIVVWGCGGGGTGQMEGGSEPECPVLPQTLSIHVASSLPPDLSTECANASSIEAFLLVPGGEACELDIESSYAIGCCTGVVPGQNPYVDLYFRDAASNQALGMQSKLIYLPKDSGDIFSLNFEDAPFDGTPYDSDNDGNLNFEEFCSGTL